MKVIQGIDVLPKPLRVLALAFLDSDPYAPVIVEMTEDEIADLRSEEEVVFQLVFDRKYEKWYLVAVGDYERMIASELIDHDPFRIRRSILAFTPVNEAWIRAKRHEYESKMIRQKPYEWDEEGSRWI